MELATKALNKNGSAIKNCCRLYLRVISIYDLLLLDKTTIHPAYFLGERPPSRTPITYWPDYPRPPKNIGAYGINS
jgi:hypothetical protein